MKGGAKTPPIQVTSSVNHGCGAAPSLLVKPNAYHCPRCGHVMLNPFRAPRPTVPPTYL